MNILTYVIVETMYIKRKYTKLIIKKHQNGLYIYTHTNVLPYRRYMFFIFVVLCFYGIVAWGNRAAAFYIVYGSLKSIVHCLRLVLFFYF